MGSVPGNQDCNTKLERRHHVSLHDGLAGPQREKDDKLHRRIPTALQHPSSPDHTMQVCDAMCFCNPRCESHDCSWSASGVAQRGPQVYFIFAVLWNLVSCSKMSLFLP